MATTNFEAIDTVAIALLASEAPDLPSLSETATLVPPPSSMKQGQAPPHELFRKTKARKQPYQFELPDDCPSQIKPDIERLVKLATNHSKTPPRLAYPWARQMAWSDPQEYPTLTWCIGDPYRGDEDGYRSIPELLDQSQELDPTRPKHLRLWAEDLGRIAIGISSAAPPNAPWVGNKPSGLWKRLLSDPALHADQVKITKQLRAGTYACPGEAKSYKSFEHREDDSDLEDKTGLFTVLPPMPAVDGGFPVASPDEEQERDDDEEAEDELEEKRRADEFDNGDHDEDQDDDHDDARDDGKHVSDGKKNDAGVSSKSKHPDRSKPFVIIPHANQWAACAVLGHVHDGVIQPVRFKWRVLNDAELRYHIAEKEALAVIRVLQVFKTLVEGCPLIVEIQYSVLKWMIKSKAVDGRTLPWGVAQSHYDLDIRKVQRDEDGLTAILGAHPESTWTRWPKI
ncbi:unnamed protein product [Phytophthora fragariaefolia]|uniref:Unnamed protein product n=1 Tax=Phytophthora fragariaefolia TaxID=1490495 RepID=A0A9W6XMU2_9STRA|nr:unnamed protein product [Phytophthora fragariaefolia]